MSGETTRQELIDLLAEGEVLVSALRARVRELEGENEKLREENETFRKFFVADSELSDAASDAQKAESASGEENQVLEARVRVAERNRADCWVALRALLAKVTP